MFENATETLTWLTSILAVDKAEAIFVHGDGRKIISTKACLSTNSFRWIWLRDGRSYIFPGKRDFRHNDYLKLYNPQTLGGRMLKYILEIAIFLDIRFPYVKQLHLVVTNITGGNQASDYLLTEYLKKVLGRKDLLFAFSCGTPGPQRKPVISIIDNSGRALAYTKIGWNDYTNSLVRNEHEVLDMLNQRHVFRTLKFPSVIWFGSWNAKSVLVTRPGGEAGRKPRGLEPNILAALIEIGKVKSENQIFGQSYFAQKVKVRLMNLKPLDPLTAGQIDQLREAFDFLMLRLSGISLPFGWKHGDFSSWNMWIKDNHVFLIDWERAENDTVLAWDLFYFLLEGRGSHRVLSSLRGLEPGRQAEQYFQAFDINTLLYWPLIAVFLVDIIAFYWQTNVETGSLRAGQIKWFYSRLELLKAIIGKVI